jgi:hypothetical protein
MGPPNVIIVYIDKNIYTSAMFLFFAFTSLGYTFDQTTALLSLLVMLEKCVIAYRSRDVLTVRLGLVVRAN